MIFNNNNNNRCTVFIYRSILKMGRIVSEQLSIIINITTTTTKTTGKENKHHNYNKKKKQKKQRKIVKPRLAVDLNTFIQYKD